MGKKVRRIKNYNSGQKIMLVGEGDLSNLASLAASSGTGLNMVATSLHSEELLKEKQWSSEANFKELETLMGYKVVHELDVYDMIYHPILKQMKFHVLVFIFPHAAHLHGYFERDEELIQGMLNQGGEVHVTRGDDHPYKTWELENLAAKLCFNLKEKVRFKKRDCPGYDNKGAGDVTFKFHLDKNFDHQLLKNDHDDAVSVSVLFRYLVIQKLQKLKPHGLQESAILCRKPAGKKRRRVVEFEVGDFVQVVLTKDRVPVGQYNILAGQMIGPFEIIEKIDSNTYRLNLLSHIQTYDVFIGKHLFPYCGDRCYEEDSTLRVNSLQPGEDDADLIACRYLDWFEHQVEKYKQRCVPCLWIKP